MDNQSALLADWDLPTLKDLLQELDDGEVDMDLTGFNTAEIEDLMTQFHVDGVDMPDMPSGDKAGFQQMTFTLSDDQAEQVNKAISKAKSLGAFVDTGNENSNGNALSRVAESYIG